MSRDFDISYRNIWKISVPIILGLVAQNIINVVDTIFLARLSELALGVGAIGGLYYFTFIIFGFGFGTGVQIMIGRRNGEGNYAKIGSIFTQSLYVMLIMSLLLFLVIVFFSDGMLDLLIKRDALAEETKQFMYWRRWGIFFAFINIVLRAFFVGVLKTKILIYSMLLMTVVNIVFDYGLIFGYLGMPEMGVSGAALASVFAEISATIFLLVWTVLKVDNVKYSLFSFVKPSMALVKSIFVLSVPMMLQNFVSFGAWFTFFLIIEKIGERELAVSNIARSIYMVLMIPVWGLSSATNSIVSNLMGKGEYDKIIITIKRIALMSLSFTLFIIAAYVFFPEAIIRLYTADPILINETKSVLYVVAFSLLFFSVSFIVFSAVSGTGKTFLALIIEVFTVVLYIFGVYYFGIVLNLNIEWVWGVEIGYFFILGLLSVIYFVKYNWRKVNIY